MAARPSAVTLGPLVEGAGALLVFIGAYVPWVVTFALVSGVPVRGVDTPYGRLLPLAALAVFALLAWRWYARREGRLHLVIVALGLLLLVRVGAYVIQVERSLSRAQEQLARSSEALPGTVSVRFDVGLYLTVAGAAALVAGGVLARRQDVAQPGGS